MEVILTVQKQCHIKNIITKECWFIFVNLSWNIIIFELQWIKTPLFGTLHSHLEVWSPFQDFQFGLESLSVLWHHWASISDTNIGINKVSQPNAQTVAEVQTEPSAYHHSILTTIQKSLDCCWHVLPPLHHRHKSSADSCCVFKLWTPPLHSPWHTTISKLYLIHP